MTTGRRAGDVIDPASADLLREVVESSGELVALLDDQFRVRFANNALRQLVGRDLDDGGVEDLLALVHPDDAGPVRSGLAEAVAGPTKAVDVSFRITPRRGELRYLEAHVDGGSGVGTVLTMRDVTDRMHVDHALRTARAGNQILVRSSDELSLLRGMCETIVQVGGYRLAWVGYAQDDAEHSVLPVAAAGEVDYVEGIRISWADNELGRGPTGTAIRTNAVQVARDLSAARRFRPWRDRAMAHGFRASCVLPLSQDRRVIGALNIYSDEVGAFEGPALTLLEELADDLIYGIAKLRDAARVTAAFDASVEALRTMSELRDPYLAGHQHRVGVLAGAIARELGLPEVRATWIRVAGEVHDVGMVVVPIEILARPGGLSDAERVIVRGHAEAGYEIVRRIHFPGQVAEIVRQHHERLDGSGYPRGLRGKAVLVGSRILAVADTVEAMSNARPYRPALDIEQVLAEIGAGAGTRYDADVAAACVKLFERDGFSFGEVPKPTTWDSWVQPLERVIPHDAAEPAAR